MNRRISVTRKDLYDRVWSTPIRTLAKEFGISDVGLAKLCRRHQIPVPGLGYWARRQHGQNPPQEPFPEAKSQSEGITIQRTEPKPVKGLSVEEKRDIPRLKVEHDRPTSHPMVKRIERSIAQAKHDERKMLLATSGVVNPVKVSAASLPRVLRLLDALFHATDQAGYQIEWPAPQNVQFKFTAQDEKLALYVAEGTTRKEHQMTSEEIARQRKDTWWRPERWAIAPNGLLRFALTSCEFQNVTHSWNDGKRQNLEDCLGEIVYKLGKMATEIKTERTARAEAARQHVEEQKRQAEESARKAEYDRKAKAIKRLATAWEESRLIKGFCVSFKRTLQETKASDDLKRELEALIEWGSEHADFVDPLTDLEWTADQFKKPSWLWG